MTVEYVVSKQNPVTVDLLWRAINVEDKLDLELVWLVERYEGGMTGKCSTRANLFKKGCVK